MKNIKFSRLFAAMMFVAVLSFAGCKQQPEETPKTIEGKWVCEFTGGKEVYEITSSSIDNYGEYSGYPYQCYAGDNLVVDKISETEGYLYIKLTRAFCPTHSDYDTDAPDVGKWYAIFYFDLDENSVKLSAASNRENNGVSSCDTLQEAKTEFTLEKGYMSKAANHYSACTRE